MGWRERTARRISEHNADEPIKVLVIKQPNEQYVKISEMLKAALGDAVEITTVEVHDLPSGLQGFDALSVVSDDLNAIIP